MFTLGINAAFHDPSASLVKDGKVLAAVEEERFNRIKHGKRPLPFNAYELPFSAIDYCLSFAGITLKDVDFIAYSYDPFISKKDNNPWSKLFETYIRNAPKFLIGREPPLLPKTLKNIKLAEVLEKWRFVEHHLAHAASAFLPSPYGSAAVLTIDGQGENTSTAYWYGKGNSLSKLGEVNIPHSLGILYEKVTEYLGFLNSSDEYKVMALASYGEPEFIPQFNELISLKRNGKYQFNTLLTLKSFESFFGPKREKGQPFEQKHFNIAHSLQNVLENTVLNLINWLYKKTGEENLCMAGGVALNCVMNAKIRDKGPFKKIWIQPAAGDSGTSLGAALYIDSQNKADGEKLYTMDHAYLGPEFSDDDIEKVLKANKLKYKKFKMPAEEIADLLVKDKIVGWFQGRLEFGPRALGARSILASPMNPKMQMFLNHIKDREDFRPVAPVVLEEQAHIWFKNASYSPFMLFVYDIADDKAEKIPAVKHVDGTARIQTINRKQNQKYYDLIKAFEQRTGVPILVNTSFNKDEPIVCKIEEAIKTFYATPLDVLVIGSYVLEK